MEPTSGPASRRHVPWSRLLLAVSLLTFWTLPTATQLTVETVPPLAAEGSDVLLLAHKVTKNTLGYAWYRGESVDSPQLIASYRVDTNATTDGPVYSGRETLYPNGTLLIQNVTQRDTGPYTLLVTKRDLRTERQTGHLHVYPPVARPSLQASNATVTEHEGPVVLTCLTDETGVSIRWFFKGQSLLLAERMTLSSDKSTLTIDPVSREDAGDYQCEAFNRGNSSRSDPLRLHVTLQENTRALGVGAVIGIMVAVLLVLTPLAGLGRFIFLHRGKRPPVSTSGRGPSGISVSQELLRADTDIYCDNSHTDLDLSSSRHVSLTDLRKTLPETQDPSEVKRESLRQRTSSGTCGYSGTWAQAQGQFLETLTGCPEPWMDQNSGCDSRSWGRFQQGK